MSGENGLIWAYGPYKHQPGEVYPASIEARPRLMKDSNIRWATDYRFEIKGDFCSANGVELTPAQVTTRIDELETAYFEDYKDCGFYLSDGVTKTAHWMESDDAFNLSGNQVLHRSWEHSGPTEYANTRSFAITVGATWQQNFTHVVYFKEHVTKFGTGGPRKKMYNLFNGTPVFEQISVNSKVIHVQQGTVIGVDYWPIPPDPYWPLEEHVDQREITQSSPEHFGDQDFSKGRLYQVNYTYRFERSGPSPITGNSWYI